MARERDDLTGQKFGKLTVIEFDKSHKGKYYWWWACECTPEETKSLDAASVKSGNTKSCGKCITHHPIEDMTGQKFGKLTAVKYDRVKLQSHHWIWSCECNNIQSISVNDVTSGKISSCTDCVLNVKDITGNKYGKLTAIRFIRQEPSKNNASVWLCKCDCGNNAEITYGNLRSGNVKSCGCLNNRKGSKSSIWKGAGVVSSTYYSQIKWSAKQRGIALDVDIYYIADLLDKQNHTCALTGLPLTPPKIDDNSASLDRIDSTLPYKEGNLQWLHKSVNKMKDIFSQEYFIEMCNKVAQTHPRSNNKHLNNTITMSELMP